MAKSISEAELEAKWGKAALALGWTPVPTALMFLQSELGMSAIEMNTLIHLLSHWWKVSDEVYPSQDAIANRMGVSKRTVQRSIDRLELLKLIEVKPTPRGGKYNGRNIYNLKPIAVILEQAAPNLRNRRAMAREWKMESNNE